MCQALPSSPPSAGRFLARRPSAFLFPCLFRVCPFRARCVVLVFSPFFSFFFCVPLLGFLLGSCHLIFILISCSFSFHLPCCGRVCVCVFHLNRCKTSMFCRGVWHSCPTTRNEAVGMSGMGNLASFLYLQKKKYIYIYIYIVPPLGAYKSQLGGTYTLSLLVYTVNVSCDLIYIYICFLLGQFVVLRDSVPNRSL